MLNWPIYYPTSRQRFPQQWETTRLSTDLPDTALLDPLASGNSAKHKFAEIREKAELASPRIKRHAETVYIGAQKIISDPPRPTNHIQTILQPERPDLPMLETFVPLPNLMMQASAPSNSLSTGLADFPAPRLPAPSPVRPEAWPAQTSGSEGTDERTLLVISPASGLGAHTTAIPAGEVRGQFVQETLPDNATAGGETGSSTTGGTASVAAVHDGSPLAVFGGSSGNRGTAGTGAFPGITIQGGEQRRDTSPTWRPQPAGKAQERASYDLTVISSGNSGGGLGDFGTFHDEPVFTVYIEMTSRAGYSLPAWILQYAFAGTGEDLHNALSPPFPQNRVLPDWPTDLSARFAGETIVVRARIGEDGKVREAHVLQTPGAQLNQALLNALEKWTFKPAGMNGQPVEVKALLGVPVVP